MRPNKSEKVVVSADLCLVVDVEIDSFFSEKIIFLVGNSTSTTRQRSALTTTFSGLLGLIWLKRVLFHASFAIF